MNRHEEREKAMITVYEDLLAERDLDELIEDTYQMKVEEVDPYFVDVIRTAIKNKDRYAGYINEVLKDWTFDRLGMIEKAILLNGCAEFDLKQLSAAVIIDESVEMARKYCDKDAYKLINRVLDVI
ncbi:MAG: transcription antitermination factor NusB [Erysipelotrichaceae bacterium]|jgi:N utilization substance protein B|uniref:Transcription antitermination factor NusB n=1 Tax=Grylomicrobium aquisgranensis TaxID=2926318 RepID=A0AB35U4V7_9FIRM|nr:transcription antitermination factor NusB [Lactimicrobium massiliense]MCH4020090.1 transcription antitermination factor NusB [Erysipelotrichaceae bacterium]MCI1325812.1 transcription antitermination factor NusB [Solobacterium sp.]MDX8420153.1 transcription antitermination factor NusB [Stecheria sp. CLA-KB-P133]MCH4044915.1 transcription antitermination factor NusB [Erysipelotrichaceae bacterium]MCH4122127.1 transcription antitermination factor NusB [Erysipelotrichaceae bacterium]